MQSHQSQRGFAIITAMLGAPRIKAIRGFSDFGFSYVYVIFEEGTDIYWARSRTLEYLSKIQPRLPEGVKTELGPDATGVGWVFQYALVDTTGTHSLADLRSIQDWNIRYDLQSVPGVAEVASLGGFVRQYQVTVDPNRLAAYRLPLMTVVEAIRASNSENQTTCRSGGAERMRFRNCVTGGTFVSFMRPVPSSSASMMPSSSSIVLGGSASIRCAATSSMSARTAALP